MVTIFQVGHSISIFQQQYLDDDVRGGPPTPQAQGTPSPPPLLALDLGHGFRLSLRHCFACCHWLLTLASLVRSTSYDLRIASCLRVWHAHSFTDTLFQSCVFMFWSCIFHIQHTSFVNSFCPNQGPAVVVVMVSPEPVGWLALPVHHHRVVQNGILGFHFVFVLQATVSNFWATFMVGAKNTSYL